LVWQDYIPGKLQELYEIRDYHHCAAILAKEFPAEFGELCEALVRFRISTEDIILAGGNESRIPKIISQALRPLGWQEVKLRAELVVDGNSVKSDTHWVDYVKGRVAFDIEWNSKDQTFDRDLYAFRTFFEFNRISAAVLMTRSNDLDSVFAGLGTFTDKYGQTRPVRAKYGASTTHLGKLWPRLDAGRHGGCPILVFGITRKLITDWKEQE
jgi:CRISPR-associated protein Csd2